MNKKIIVRKTNAIKIPKSFTIDTGMTQSLWGTFLDCRQKFVLKLNRYTSKRTESTTNFGALIHHCLDKIYSANEHPTVSKINEYIDSYYDAEKEKISLIDSQQMEYEAALGEATLRNYVEHFKNDFIDNKYFDVEQVFDTLFNKQYRMKGKIDGKYRALDLTKWLMEHKTKGQINVDNILNGLPLNFQNLYYLEADELETGEPAEGVLYNIIRKSGMKPKKGESIFNYKNRMIVDIESRPEYYFFRFPVSYTPRQRKDFRTSLLAKFLEMEKLLNGENPVYKNEFSCLGKLYACEFLEACATNSMLSYIQKKSLFTELEDKK